MLLMFSLLVETDELQVNGQVVGFTESDLATIVESCDGKNGAYFSAAVKRRLAELLHPDIDFRSLSNAEQRTVTDSIQLPKLAAVREAAQRIGYTWNEDRMRGGIESSPQSRRTPEGNYEANNP
jgi:hypothetical protein